MGESGFANPTELSHRSTWFGRITHLGQLGAIVARLRAHGRSGVTPVAVISRATEARQVVVLGTLADIVMRSHGLATPATIVIGEVAALSTRLAWFEPADGPRAVADAG